jgi:hypothetical protein
MSGYLNITLTADLVRHLSMIEDFVYLSFFWPDRPRPEGLSRLTGEWATHIMAFTGPWFMEYASFVIANNTFVGVDIEVQGPPYISHIGSLPASDNVTELDVVVAETIRCVLAQEMHTYIGGWPMGYEQPEFRPNEQLFDQPQRNFDCWVRGSYMIDHFSGDTDTETQDDAFSVRLQYATDSEPEDLDESTLTLNSDVEML